MIIYEVTNKYIAMDELYFSKYYPTKDVALLAKKPTNEVYRLELYSIGRDEVASILSMNHVKITQNTKGWHELHDISHLTILKEKIS